jgi:hypothetical protein
MTSKQYDKFYTKTETVKYILSFIDFGSFDIIVEPSAGSGNFSNLLSFYKKNVIAIDILPENSNIIQKDFLKDNLDLNQNTIVIGNPPFGKNASLAIKFFNKAASYINVLTIAFILPKSFKKPSIQNRLNLYFWLDKTIELDSNSFILDNKDYSVPCVFQIWIRKTNQRIIKPKLELINPVISFINYKDINKYSNIISIRRVGFYAGRAYIYNNNSAQSHYFLNTSIDVNVILSYINNIKWTFEDTVGPRSISKQQFIEKLNKIQI